jgi:hypothetical protein
MLKRIEAFLLVLVIMTFFYDTQALSLSPRSHHIKRQNAQPQLTLDVEQIAGQESTHHTTLPTPEYYFATDSNLVLNFTCTIKNPAYRYTLVMTKEPVLPSKIFK